MNTIHLTDADLMPEAQAKALEGQVLDSSHFDRVVTDATTIYKPDGSILLMYAPNAVPRSVCTLLFKEMGPVRLRSDNRGTAGGFKAPRIRSDGTPSKTREGLTVESGVFGFMDRTQRIPFARLTALSIDYPEAFRATRVLAQHADKSYRELAPEAWARQRAFVDRISPDFVIPGTTFTTITANRRFKTLAHKDDGNFRDGLAVTVVLEGGSYEGGLLVFPRLRSAVDMRTGGLLLADVAGELHGNTPMVGQRYVRYSFVLYTRAGFTQCGSAKEEKERVIDLKDSLFLR